ncbi:MAG: hypothetical protein LBD95_05825 [Clostridiales Family XIII bacterium]|jgi:hypothetical protein|nr:hypothetical protein [Clostridiales Family XIII bacterium]
MKNPNTIEKELNAIRVSLYEETKDMSSSELTAYIKAQTESLLKEHGIIPVCGTRGKAAESKRITL